MRCNLPCSDMGAPYRMRVADATSGDTFSASHLRMNACTSCACAGDATCAHGSRGFRSCAAASQLNPPVHASRQL